MAVQAANVQEIAGNGEEVQRVMASVEGASVLIDDVDTSLGILDLKLKHMRADITAIEARNNSLQVRETVTSLLKHGGYAAGLRPVNSMMISS